MTIDTETTETKLVEALKEKTGTTWTLITNDKPAHYTGEIREYYRAEFSNPAEVSLYSDALSLAGLGVTNIGDAIGDKNSLYITRESLREAQEVALHEIPGFVAQLKGTERYERFFPKLDNVVDTNGLENHSRVIQGGTRTPD